MAVLLDHFVVITVLNDLASNLCNAVRIESQNWDYQFHVLLLLLSGFWLGGSAFTGAGAAPPLEVKKERMSGIANDLEYNARRSAAIQSSLLYRRINRSSADSLFLVGF